MRTTLTLDDDVAALLERVVAQRRSSLKAVVNDALRHGLRQISVTKKEREKEPFRTEPVSMGRCLVGSLDDIEEVLSIAEGEWHK